MLEYVTTHDDPSHVFTRWVIDGANRANTAHGRIYARTTSDVEDCVLSLYGDAARTALIATGTLNAASTGNVVLTEQNDSGVSGSVHLQNATALDATLDVFYADDADLSARQKDIGGFVIAGEFAGRPGFSDPLARAKRVIDALMNARFPEGWRADDLQPLADATACYALYFIYDHLSTRTDDAAAQLASAWRRNARRVLPLIRLNLNGEPTTPFITRVERA